MKLKTQDLIGAALDWAVASLEKPADGHLLLLVDGQIVIRRTVLNHTYDFICPCSTNWAQGGPIIERERIGLDYYPDGGHPDGGAWGAATCEGMVHCVGPTPLIAAMRAYVASRLGDEVEVPDELVA